MVTDRDNGAQALIERIKARVTVRAGIVGDAASEAHSDSGMTVGQIAALHEFGIGVPARPFVRPVIDEIEQGDRSIIQKLGRDIWRGISPKAAAEKEGAELALRMKQRIDRGIGPPLSPATIARKGHSKALLDTEQMYNAISYEVEIKK